MFAFCPLSHSPLYCITVVGFHTQAIALAAAVLARGNKSGMTGEADGGVGILTVDIDACTDVCALAAGGCDAAVADLDAVPGNDTGAACLIVGGGFRFGIAGGRAACGGDDAIGDCCLTGTDPTAFRVIAVSVAAGCRDVAAVDGDIFSVVAVDARAPGALLPPVALTVPPSMVMFVAKMPALTEPSPDTALPVAVRRPIWLPVLWA